MSNSRFLEIEAKFAVDAETPRPDLTELSQVDTVAEERNESLSAIYYDTEDLRLTRSKITLRRRTGGHDDGWHIKLPGTMGRLEIRAELTEPADGGDYVIPESLLAQVRSIVRNKELHPVAQVDNNRCEIVYADAHGTPVAEFCDDRVTARSFLPGGEETSWREWEVELTGAMNGTEPGMQLLKDASDLLVAGGARTADSPSKLATALGDSVNNAPLPPFAQTSDLDEDSAAYAVVRALQANRDKLVAYDPRVRADEWDSVHQMRVATRELRSHMQTFHGIVAGPEIERIEADLKVLASYLGIARDAEVVEERWKGLLESDDSGVLDEATREHLSHDMGRAYRRAHRRVVAGLNSQRYLDLLDSLDALLANPPVVEAAAQPADAAVVPESDDAAAESTAAPAPAGEDMETVMARHLNEAYDKLVRRHKKAIKNRHNMELTLHEREEYFHDMRKAAKKLRYAAEAAGKASGLKTKKVYKACKQMQEVLGDFQDSVTSRDKLVEVTAAARRRGEDTFGYGMLYQLERSIGQQALEDYEEAFEDIKEAFVPLRKKMKRAEKERIKAAKLAAEKAAKKRAKAKKAAEKAAKKKAKEEAKAVKQAALAAEAAKLEEDKLFAEGVDEQWADAAESMGIDTDLDNPGSSNS